MLSRKFQNQNFKMDQEAGLFCFVFVTLVFSAFLEFVE